MKVRLVCEANRKEPNRTSTTGKSGSETSSGSQSERNGTSRSSTTRKGRNNILILWIIGKIT